MEAKGKLGLNSSHKDGHGGAVAIPTSTPTCVIVKSFKAALDKPRGTIKLKTQMDNSFSIFLRGKITEDQFQTTIEGINWFAHLLHEAEVEFYAEAYSSSVAWKDYHAELVVQDKRNEVLAAYCKANDLMFSPARARIATDAQMKEHLQRVLTALHEFIDDENKRIYLPAGVQWHYPEKNQWRWLEIHILPDGSEKPKVAEPLLPIPTSPEFGESLKFEVLDTLSINDHAEYIIHITSNLKEWHPISDTFVLRRFNDFKDFYNKLNEYMEHHEVEIGMPQVPDGSYIGRKSRSTLLKRKALFQDLLDAISSSKDLRVAEPVLRFFGVEPDPSFWKFSPYLHRQLELQ